MTIDTTAIIKLITDLMGEHPIQVTVRQSIKGALITGACSFVGGMVAGPLGFAVGGASGGLLAAYQTNGTFKPIKQILNELPFERKQQIAAEIESILEKLEINDLAEFIRIAAIYHTLGSSQPNHILVQQFIERSIPVIQRHIQM